MSKRVALITRTGEMAHTFAELLHKGYIVHGIKRRSSSFNTGRVDHLYQDPHSQEVRFVLHYGDMTDATNLIHCPGHSTWRDLQSGSPEPCPCLV